MITTILKTIMLLGVLAFIAIIIGLLVAARGTQSAAPVAQHAQHVQPVHPVATPLTGLAPPTPPVLATGAGAVSDCRNTNTHCREALLFLINGDRRAHHVAPITLDMTQTMGRSTPGEKCAGTRGHTRAMAKTGRTWHTDPHHRAASYPRDICYPGVRSAENVTSASGASWAAIQSVEQRTLASKKQRAHLLSSRFTRLGLDLEQHGLRTFVTEDFLAR